MIQIKPSGLIYNIKRYSVNDGPGIRQTIFFKGCPLSCWWCHNPESRGVKSERTLRKIMLDGVPFSQSENIGKMMDLDELMLEINKDRIFYDESGGGVTFSGGEPLLQHDFLEELLKKCRKQKIHTTVDTSGYADIEVLDRISNLADLILYDLKHMDPLLHKKYTGITNTNVINNLIWLDVHKKNVHIRFPVIPQINDTEENIMQMKEFLKRLRHIRKISLLPFHRIAEHKYRQMNIENKMEGVKSLEKENLSELRKQFESIGFEVSIGN